MTEIKPTAFQRGVPAEQSNGFYGIEKELIARPSGEQIVAVVTYAVEEVMEKRNAGETWPVVKALHIEPLHDAKAIETALALRDEQYKSRTSEGALDLGDEDGE